MAPRGAHLDTAPALPLVRGLRVIVPGDALGSHVELPQPRCFGSQAPPACQAGAQDHQDPEARAAWEHGCFRAPPHQHQLHHGAWVGPPHAADHAPPRRVSAVPAAGSSGSLRGAVSPFPAAPRPGTSAARGCPRLLGLLKALGWLDRCLR